MEFNFQPLEKRTVYDNHGCPANTQYYMDFTVDSVKFTAHTHYFSDGVEITIGRFSHTSSLNADGDVDNLEVLHSQQNMQKAIKRAFEENSELQKIFHMFKGDTTEFAVGNVYKKLLADTTLDWS